MNTERSKNRVPEAKGKPKELVTSQGSYTLLWRWLESRTAPSPISGSLRVVCSIHKSSICESQTHELGHSELMREEKMRTVEGFPKGKEGINSGPS